MRANANQREIPLDAPLGVVFGCKSEADAVRRCLRIAWHRYERDQKTVAAMTGWKSDSCLCEIASESNKRRIPKAKMERFAIATGCNLVLQYRERMKAEARNKGLTIQRDEADCAAVACLSAWGIRAASPYAQAVAA
jgi:hypothetical protein